MFRSGSIFLEKSFCLFFFVSLLLYYHDWYFFLFILRCIYSTKSLYHYHQQFNLSSHCLQGWERVIPLPFTVLVYLVSRFYFYFYSYAIITRKRHKMKNNLSNITSRRENFNSNQLHKRRQNNFALSLSHSVLTHIHRRYKPYTIHLCSFSLTLYLLEPCYFSSATSCGILLICIDGSKYSASLYKLHPNIQENVMDLNLKTEQTVVAF